MDDIKKIIVSEMARLEVRKYSGYAHYSDIVRVANKIYKRLLAIKSMKVKRIPAYGGITKDGFFEAYDAKGTVPKNTFPCYIGVPAKYLAKDKGEKK